MPKNVKKRRNRHKYPTLVRNMNTKVRQEYLDYDYIDGVQNNKKETVIRPLNDEEKQFLDDFNKEYYCASVGKQKDEGKNNRFMKSKEEVKECQYMNNARQRDMYGLVRSKVGASKLISIEKQQHILEEYYSERHLYVDYEDALIDVLDNANNLKNTAKNTNKNSDKS